uniref:Uncharacterized protein n=1 Tax=Parascaris equorum TaxID=6256 RepID=A0A914S2H4_PAREQ
MVGSIPSPEKDGDTLHESSFQIIAFIKPGDLIGERQKKRLRHTKITLATGQLSRETETIADHLNGRTSVITNVMKTLQSPFSSPTQLVEKVSSNLQAAQQQPSLRPRLQVNAALIWW